MQGPPPAFEDNPELFDIAFNRVKKTFVTGKTKSYKYRMAALASLKKGMTELQSEFDKALTADLGKDTFVNWLFEQNLIFREIDHSMDHLHEWMEDECVNTPMSIGPAKSYIQKEPLGVVVVIGAWNFPLFTTLGPMISAMSAGNAVVLKPSEMSPYVARTMQKMFDTYLDPEAF